MHLLVRRLNVAKIALFQLRWMKIWTVLQNFFSGLQYVLAEATIVTTIDDEVLELCTSAVASTPIIRPPTGFCSNWLCENAAPAVAQRHSPCQPICHVKFVCLCVCFGLRQAFTYRAIQRYHDNRRSAANSVVLRVTNELTTVKKKRTVRVWGPQGAQEQSWGWSQGHHSARRHWKERAGKSLRDSEN